MRGFNSESDRRPAVPILRNFLLEFSQNRSIRIVNLEDYKEEMSIERPFFLQSSGFQRAFSSNNPQSVGSNNETVQKSTIRVKKSFDCEICHETFHRLRLVPLECGHQYCKICFQYYIEQLISDKRVITSYFNVRMSYFQ